MGEEPRTISLRELVAQAGTGEFWQPFWQQVAARETDGAVLLLTLASFKEVGDRYGILPADLCCSVMRVVFDYHTAHDATARLRAFTQAAAYYETDDIAALAHVHRAATAITAAFPMTITTKNGDQLPVRVECAVAARAAGENIPGTDSNQEPTVS